MKTFIRHFSSCIFDHLLGECNLALKKNPQIFLSRNLSPLMLSIPEAPLQSRDGCSVTMEQVTYVPLHSLSPAEMLMITG